MCLHLIYAALCLAAPWLLCPPGFWHDGEPPKVHNFEGGGVIAFLVLEKD